MSAISSVLENRMLDWSLNVGTPTRPSALYIALFTTMPSADNGTGAVEVSGAGYARKQVTFGSASNGISSNVGTTSDNGQPITWTASGGDYDTVVGVGIYDTSSTGTLLYFGNLTSERTVRNGDTLNFTVGALTVSLE